MYRLPLRGEGIYPLNYGVSNTIINQPFHSYIYMRAKSPTTGNWVEYFSYENSGEIEITRQSDEGVSGVFTGKLKTQNGDEIVEITEGRFDIDYQKLNEE